MLGLIEIVLANAVVAGGLAIIALLVTRMGRWPAVAHILWVLVLVKLVSPPVLEAPIGLSWPSSLVVVNEPAAAETVGMAAQAAGHAPGAGGPMSTASRQPSNWLSTRDPALFVVSVWVLGSIYCLAILLIRTIRFHRGLEQSMGAPMRVKQLVAQLSSQLGLSTTPQTRLVSKQLSPLVWVTPGRQVVVLPERLIQRIDQSSLETLLAHELAHLRRRDHWIRLLETIATVLLWWHPLVWLARHQIRVTEEMCCDAWVVAILPKSSGTYARTLIETVSFLSVSKSSVPSLASGMGPVSSMRRRIIMIMQASTNRTTSLSSRAALALLALIALPLAPSIAQDGNTSQDQNKAVTVATSGKQQVAKPADKSECECAMCCLGLSCLADCFAKCTLEDCQVECLSCRMRQGEDGKLQCVMRLKDGTTKTIPMCNIGDGSCLKLLGATGIFGKRSIPAENSPSDAKPAKSQDLQRQLKELQKQLNQLKQQLQDR